jgi:HAMP domain-containing protein
MDLRTKFVFALVAVALASMMTLGAFTYEAVRDLLHRMAIRQLEAVAESKKQDLERVTIAWRDRVQLIASGTRLRERLVGMGREVQPGEREELRLLLDDALRSLRALRGITAYSAAGFPLASAGLAPDAEDRLHPSTFYGADSPVVFQNVFHDPAGDLVVAFIAPVRDEGRNAGAVKVLLSARELVSVTEQHTGLGDTGETMIALRTEDGGALVVNPLRHDPDASLRLEIPAERTDDPLIQALSAEEPPVGIARDYRGHEVWAATRTLKEFDWALAVKIDADEETRTITELRDTMGRLALSLSAFAIVAGTLLGLYVTRPIHALADVVRRIGEGELDVRANDGGEDEIGQLAKTVNQMAEELIEKNRELERRVGEGSRVAGERDR